MGTDFLFARPGAVYGIARLIDLWARLDRYNVSRTPDEADARALASDWDMIRADIWAALEQLTREDPEFSRALESYVESNPRLRDRLQSLVHEQEIAQGSR